MAAFQRDQRRFFCRGVCLNAPPDMLPEGKFAVLQNVRGYQDGTLVSRAGLTALANGALGAGVVHSIARLNDSTPFAATAFWRVFGKGVAIFAGPAGGPYPQIDTGYSGNPLSLVTAAPVQAPNPYMYVGDATRMRKFDLNGHVYPIGIAPPATAPSAVTGFLYTGFVFDSGAAPVFVPAGVNAGAVAVINRINTNITSIFYDSGATGNASVVPVLFAAISPSAIIVFNGVEAVPVQEVCPAIAATTIGQIIYDAGVAGLCTIQPADSLGNGQIEVPGLADYLARQGQYAAAPGTEGTPPSASDPGAVATHTIRQIDFPVNCLVVINGVETVRILSVAVGADGVQSFRCSTAGTFAAGQTLTGVSSFRCSTAGAFAAGQTLQAAAFSNIITPPVGPPPQTVGGIQSPGGWVIVNNLAKIVGRATQPDDDIHISVRLSNCTVVDGIRIYLDVDSATNDFTRNYFFFEWRPSDIIAAIQSANAVPVSTVQTVRPTTVSNAILDTGPYPDVQNPDAPYVPPPVQPGAGIAIGTASDQLAMGNSQWLELSCKIGQLTRVGTDPSRTLANVVAAEIITEMHGAAALQVDYASFWVSGGFGPDTGSLGIPVAYAYRYRSSTTGAKSNPSPAMPAGVIPRRQLVTLTGVQSTDGQCDLVDWFRIGGTLPKMTYTGTTANANPPTFVDTFRDADISGGERLAYDAYQPWATTDKARTGLCTVAGNALRRTGGTDNFNTSWAPGTPIVINSRVYTLASRPPTATLLFLNENAGSGAGLTFVVPQPTLLAQPLSGLWGPDPVTGTVWACGDPNNPGALYWSAPNDPDRTSDGNVVLVTSGSDPLINGCLWDDLPFVWSSENLYQIQRFGTGWIALKTPCGRGLWSAQAFTAASPKGLYFVCKDGIALSPGGGPAALVTHADLAPLFPHDGVVGVAVNGITPPDFTVPARMHLSYVNGWLYFDYVDTGGTGRTLVMREADQSWWPDLSTPAIGTRLSSPGPQVFEELLGGADGTIYNPTGATDAGTGIACQARLVLDQGDARRQKLYRDAMLDADLTGSILTLTLTGNNGSTPLGSQVLGPVAGRAESFTNILPGRGIMATNLQADLAWTPTLPATPILYLLDIACQPQLELATSWLSGPTTHGFPGFQTAAAIWLAYLSSAAVTIRVRIDNTEYTYTLPSTSGVYTKTFFWLQTVKGSVFQYGVDSTLPCLVFADDTEVWVTPFGNPGYQKVRPFAMAKAV